MNKQQLSTIFKTSKYIKKMFLTNEINNNKTKKYKK